MNAIPAALKGKVTEILKGHPDYEKWEKSFASESATLDLPTFIFMRLSTWPDEIRRRGNPYDHPQWHYVDYPLKPKEFRVELGPDPTDDIRGNSRIREYFSTFHGYGFMPK